MNFFFLFTLTKSIYIPGFPYDVQPTINNFVKERTLLNKNDLINFLITECGIDLTLSNSISNRAEFLNHFTTKIQKLDFNIIFVPNHLSQIYRYRTAKKQTFLINI